MPDSTIRGSNPTPSPLPTNNSTPIETNAPVVSPKPVDKDTKTESASTKPQVNNQHGAAMKSDKTAVGNYKQNELNQKLAAGKAQIKEYPPQAGNKELDKIHVARYKTEDQTTTQFPNGVKYKQIKTSTTHSNDIRQDSSNKVRLQKAGSDVATEIEAPPGGKVSTEKDGRTIISNAKGKQVATVDKDGTLHSESKQGNYTQTPDGKIKFEQTHKGDLNTLRKAGTVDPSNYENYGITTHGNRIRFPNGVEYIKEEPVEIAGQSSRPIPPAHGVRVYIPKDLGTMIEHHMGRERYPDLLGRTHGREILVRGDNRNMEIETPGGTFIVDVRDPIRFEPKKQ